MTFHPKPKFTPTVEDFLPDEIVISIIHDLYHKYVLTGQLKESDFYESLYITVGIEQVCEIILKQTPGA